MSFFAAGPSHICVLIRLGSPRFGTLARLHHRLFCSTQRIASRPRQSVRCTFDVRLVRVSLTVIGGLPRPPSVPKGRSPNATPLGRPPPPGLDAGAAAVVSVATPARLARQAKSPQGQRLLVAVSQGLPLCLCFPSGRLPAGSFVSFSVVRSSRIRVILWLCSAQSGPAPPCRRPAASAAGRCLPHTARAYAEINLGHPQCSLNPPPLNQRFAGETQQSGYNAGLTHRDGRR